MIVRVGNCLSVWLPVGVGLLQGCGVSPWLFYNYMDGVVRVLGRGLSLVNYDDREWKINQLLFADDTTLMADSEEKLCQSVEEF